MLRRRRERIRAQKQRIRRDPEEAKELILVAAERVFARVGPDLAGLQSVAREAGVSHALITHYFSTYANLVEATLVRRITALRNRVTTALTQADELRPGELMLVVARAMMEPVNVRLVAWALLSGRMESSDFFPARQQGLRTIADALSARWAYDPSGPVPREDIDFILLFIVSALHGYAFGHTSMQTALGREPGTAADEAFVTRLAALAEQFLRSRQAVPHGGTMELR